jgi:hypothetical protein
MVYINNSCLVCLRDNKREFFIFLFLKSRYYSDSLCVSFLVEEVMNTRSGGGGIIIN